LRDLAGLPEIELETVKVKLLLFILIFSRAGLMISIPILPIIMVFFSVMVQIRSGELLHKAMLKQKEEKRKLRKLKKGT